jgi:hypothetical protein
MNNSRKPSVNANRHTRNLPDDVLVIHYADLSTKPLVRLETIAAIGQLLVSTQESQQISDLVSDSASEQALIRWLAQENPSRFWERDERKVITKRACEKHVLVGTKRLLQDLTELEKEPQYPNLKDLDLMWQAVHQYLEQTDST